MVTKWEEIIRIFAYSGLGVFDESVELTGDELQKIRKGVEKFPASMFWFQSVLLRLDFLPNSRDNPDALGGFKMGRIHLFEKIRDASPIIDYPEGVDPFTYATVHEIAHGFHTICMTFFMRLSGWTAVRDGIFIDPDSGQQGFLTPDEFIPGAEIKGKHDTFIVSAYREPPFDKFYFGDEVIKIRTAQNPANSGWIYRKGSSFVTDYAAVEPFDDYAESLSHLLLFPNLLMKRAEEKNQFMGYLFGPLM